MPDARRLAQHLWYGDSAAARLGRAVLLPMSWLFRGIVAARGAAYDAGVFAVHRAPIPVLSVGNISVGGTGKTPVAAWFATELRARGAHPAVVLRGVGGDETDVHRLLNPGIPVVASGDRAHGVSEALERGADVAVLDDAFQHRRMGRDVDVVLLNADRWGGPRHLIPAGGWREPLEALRRADLVVITRKGSDDASVSAVVDAAGRGAPGVPRAVIALEPGPLKRLDAPDTLTLASLGGERVLAVAGIADSEPFLRTLRATRPAAFSTEIYPDHHRYGPGDAERLASRAGSGTVVVCTLKDAVKLAPLWPRVGPRLWYVSQRVVVQDGLEQLEQVFDRLLRARRRHPDSPGRAPGAVFHSP